MAFRFDEYYTGKNGLTLDVKNMLYSGRSDFQKIDVFETSEWGRVLILDGMVMLSEQDEFVYHEMIVHPALSIHPNPKNILIIGGGDGGTAREALQHPTVQKIDIIEIDPSVVKVCREYFPQVHRFDDARINLQHADGAAFLQESTTAYDVIIIDGSDPVGPAKVLFSTEFFYACQQHLSHDGIFICQSESPWVEKYRPVIADMYQSLSILYSFVHPYLCAIPLYPTGLWSMMMASQTINPLSEASLDSVYARFDDIESELNYFNPEIYRASFALPGFVKTLFR